MRGGDHISVQDIEAVSAKLVKALTVHAEAAAVAAQAAAEAAAANEKAVKANKAQQEARAVWEGAKKELDQAILLFTNPAKITPVAMPAAKK